MSKKMTKKVIIVYELLYFVHKTSCVISLVSIITRICFKK